MSQTLSISLDSELCKGCEYCISVCPVQAIRLSEDYNGRGHRYAIIEDDGKCSRCRSCSVMCPEMAIMINQKVGG